MPKEVLLVDDQPEVIAHIEKILASRDYAVFSARTADEGLRRLSERAATLGLVILDLDLGRGSQRSRLSRAWRGTGRPRGSCPVPSAA
jgi:DNA-binding response OmpR family regulator